MKTKRNYVRYILLSLVLMLCLTFIPNIHVNAEGTAVDLIGDSSPASSGTVRYGVTSRQTGYLFYLLTADGNEVSPDAKFVSSSSYSFTRGADAVWSVNSRLGGY